ncbi:MAG: class I SAM-dependent methyltransferase [Pseudomonadales bacterium]|nr:class I SAM-dependent methyltransferase [Pseudomonadales bacterium]
MNSRSLEKNIDWHHWMKRWDDQQSYHLPVREERFQIMLSTVETLCSPDCIVLDLACGPGSISQRLLSQLPQSQTIAADYDPVLLKLGKETLGDAQGRLHWLKVDLNDPQWTVQIREVLKSVGRNSLDAVLSSTALHWLTTPRLIDVYREISQLLRPGGLLLNADHMAFNPSLPTFLGLAQQDKDQRKKLPSTQQVSEDFQQWWEAIESNWLAIDPSLQALFDEHNNNYDVRDRRYGKALASLHISALADAGFIEVETIWQRFDNRVMLAVRGGAEE